VTTDTDPKSADPESAKSADPESADPESANPESADPESADPQPSEPLPSGRGLRPLEIGIGAALVALAVFAGASDLGLSLRDWDSYGPVSVDDPLPSFSVTLADGTPLSDTDLEGQVSMLTFWATWCHACGLEMPTITAIEERFADEDDFHIYGVNRDDGPMPERTALVEAYTADRGMGFPQIYDTGELARGFRIEAIPHMVIVDRHARIRYVHLGSVGERTLAREIEALLDE